MKDIWTQSDTPAKIKQAMASPLWYRAALTPNEEIREKYHPWVITPEELKGIMGAMRKDPKLEVNDIYAAVDLLEFRQDVLRGEPTSDRCLRESRALKRVIQHLKEQL